MSSACSRLLVANRGEIARRVFATARAMGIETVAVYADPDAGAPFVAEADQAVALGGSTAADTYLDQAKLLAAAARSGADAVHPGYGFLSENAGFATAVIGAGLTWVGPPPTAIAAMGDKLAAKRLMIEAGVPTLPSVEITDGMIGTNALAAVAEEIGYPVLVKAAAGGGGKGMRVVDAPADLAEAVAGAQREAVSAFGDGTVFLEKYLPAPRHVEIQVLGDTHGNLVHCYERECSIQRRHQKIIEEAPSPAVDDDLRAAMGAAALDAVRVIGYHSVGTVEFLLDTDATGRAAFYFLEVNTRLQVEHPVTEEITGLDLVRQQLLVAQGLPLAFGQDELRIDGHAIEARVYAEDPAAGFLPATGTVAAFGLPAAPAARFDSGVEAGSVVGVDFDPLLAKVIVHAPTRTEAALRLALVLERMVISGVTTNRDFLVATLRHRAFLDGDTTTDFIDRVAPDRTCRPEGVDRARLLTALVLFRQARNRRAAGPLAFLPSGYRNSAMPPERVILDLDGDEVTVGYRRNRDGTFDVEPGEGEPPLRATLEACGPDGLDAVIDGVRAHYTVVATGAVWHVQGPHGRVEVVERSRFPDAGPSSVAGGQLAPMPGTVRVVSVAEGDQVSAGQALLVMEAMKMEHTVVAPEPSLVSEVRCAVGDQVDNGQVLVVLAPLSPPADPA
ncbi:MAG: biotin carboxylase N-terminal domain-containing protein [Acidimicrobiales bacterium]